MVQRTAGSAKTAVSSLHSLPADYQRLLDAQEALAVFIMGKDPFPSDPTGLPFCKATWEQQLEQTSSGRWVLSSLGFDVEQLRALPIDPPLFWRLLAAHGIAVGNLSYHFLGKGVTQRDHKGFLQAAHKVNEPLMKKAGLVVLCGEARLLCEADKRDAFGLTLPSGMTYLEAVHPDVRNFISPRDEVSAAWHEVWDPGRLAERCDLEPEAILAEARDPALRQQRGLP